MSFAPSKRPWPAPGMVWAAAGTKVVATGLVAFGPGFLTTITCGQIGLVWANALAWVFVADQAKLAV